VYHESKRKDQEVVIFWSCYEMTLSRLERKTFII